MNAIISFFSLRIFLCIQYCIHSFEETSWILNISQNFIILYSYTQANDNKENSQNVCFLRCYKHFFFFYAKQCPESSDFCNCHCFFNFIRSKFPWKQISFFFCYLLERNFYFYWQFFFDVLTCFELKLWQPLD